MKNSFEKNVLPHLISIGIFLVIIFVYFLPVLSGKTLVQTDIIQGTGTLREATVYQEKTGEEILWTNTSFSGMPIWRGFSTNILNYFHAALSEIFPVPVLICFLGFLGFYILLLAYKVNPYLSFAGALAYTFSSFNLISIEAGHLNKVFDMALMAPVLAGIVLCFRQKYIQGAALSMLAISLQVFYGHVQITYYLLILVLFYGIAEFIFYLQNKRFKDFIKVGSILVVCAIIAVAPNVSRLWTMAEYSKATIRGGSELAAKKEQKEGLDKEYALSWSNGIAETMTIFIPSFYGGSSHEDIGQDSETYKTMMANNVPKSQAKEYIKSMPLYWGDQPFTAGPVYFGAVICFLFVLALIILNDRIKWWVLGVSILAIMLSWGKNFELLTDLFFYNVPLYNKFRSVTMILAIAQVTFPLLAIVALHQIVSGEISKEKIIRGIKITTLITAGTAALFAIAGSAFFDFTSSNDEQLPEWLRGSLVEDRESIFRMSAFRSLGFVLVAAGIVWLYVQNKIKEMHLYIAFSFIILLDLWSVDKKYLNKDDFKYNKGYEKKVFAQTEADQAIAQDTDPNFRVFNLTVNPFADATTSYHHKSIGGYSAIKIGRYQELIDAHLSKNNMAVLNMLNTKYVIMNDKTNNQPFVQRNPGALGNAWFVDSVKIVNNADEELNSLTNFNPASTAVVDKRFSQELKGLTLSKNPASSIVLKSYHPNKLEYTSNSPAKGLVVFSEIYYSPGWNAYIDGKLSEHFRVNYVLRGMVVPEGQHEIKFVFEPQSYYVGEKISLAGSILLAVGLFGALGFIFYQRKKSAA